MGLLSESLPPVADADSGFSKCWRAGMCICKGRGLHVQKAHRNIEVHMKAVFRKNAGDGGQDKALWADGHVVLA